MSSTSASSPASTSAASPAATPELVTAIWTGKIHKAFELIETGADPNSVDPSSGWTALHFAAQSGNFELCDALIKRGADVNALNKRQFSPLHIACLIGKIEIVKKLIESGSLINAKNDSEWTPLHYAYRLSDPSIGELLIKHGANTEISAKLW